MKLQRLDLFEFEDFSWFPDWLRQYMTLYIVAVHRVMGTPALLTPLLARALGRLGRNKIVDLCSGGGGPMPEVVELLAANHGIDDLELTLTDLFPNQTAAAAINKQGNPRVTYSLESVDAGNVDDRLGGLRTLICSLHHMPPEVAQRILIDAWKKKQPLCVFEISDNSAPIWLWWLAIPIGVVSVLCFTPLVRPLTWQQLFFTYVIPILPLLIAWDGAVSNARTYTQSDLKQLMAGLESDDYQWEVGRFTKWGMPGGMLYILGLPTDLKAGRQGCNRPR